MKKIKRIAVLTSGGDASGMNVAIRAVVRAGINSDIEVFGVRDGFRGLINNDFVKLNARLVGGIINAGGTMLGSSRCTEFREESVQNNVLGIFEDRGISALIVIGGDGSQAGSFALSKKGFPVIGIASTIDNDLYGSDITIGVDTALNIALESIDRLRVTANSLGRVFFVEVMGRDCGYLAINCAIVGGAEAVVIPELEVSPEEVLAELQDAHRRGKRHAIVVVAEGAKHNVFDFNDYFLKNRETIGYEPRITVLGHVQRGGVPAAYDRMIATRFGAAAIENLLQGNHGVLVGSRNGRVGTTPLKEVVTNKKVLDPTLLDLARVMSI